jgi:hypothetical protein
VKIFYRLNVIPSSFRHCAGARKTCRCWRGIFSGFPRPTVVDREKLPTIYRDADALFLARQRTELRGVIQRIVIMNPTTALRTQAPAAAFCRVGPSGCGRGILQPPPGARRVQRDYILKNWTRTTASAARNVGLERSHLYRG